MDHASPGKELDEVLGGRQTQLYKLAANDGRIGASAKVLCRRKSLLLCARQQLIQGIVQGRRGVHSISLASRGLVFGPSPEIKPVLDLVRHRRWLHGGPSMMKRRRGLLVRSDPLRVGQKGAR